MKRSKNNFTIKNRLYDFVAKAISLKIFWAIVVTIIFLLTEKVADIVWIGFIMAILGLNSIDKSMFYTHNNKKEIVGPEPDEDEEP